MLLENRPDRLQSFDQPSYMVVILFARLLVAKGIHETTFREPLESQLLGSGPFREERFKILSRKLADTFKYVGKRFPMLPAQIDETKEGEHTQILRLRAENAARVLLDQIEIDTAGLTHFTLERVEFSVIAYVLSER